MCWACTQMIPRKIVSGGASSNPAFLKASPNAKIPEPTLPLNRCIMVSRYLQFVSVSDLFSTQRNIRQCKSSDISGIPVIIEIITMNQNVNMNVWYAFGMHSICAKKELYKTRMICGNFWEPASHEFCSISLA